MFEPGKAYQIQNLGPYIIPITISPIPHSKHVFGTYESPGGETNVSLYCIEGEEEGILQRGVIIIADRLIQPFDLFESMMYPGQIISSTFGYCNVEPTAETLLEMMPETSNPQVSVGLERFIRDCRFPDDPDSLIYRES